MIRSRKAAGLAVLGLVLGAAFSWADSYRVDVDHVAVYFKISHLGFSHTYGRFNTVTGAFTLDAATPANSKLELTIDANSVDTGNARRDAHLKGPDFFDVKQFEKITFKSTAMKKTGDKVWEVVGDLAMHGVTRSITVTVNQGKEGAGMQGETRTGGDLELTVKRSDFGINYGPGAIGDEVKLMISIEGIKQ
jgi:polyisoprenoid-binding protein YceI